MSKINFQNVHTMIGVDASIKGPIKLNEGIIIYGKVIGNIDTNGPVRVAQNAIVEGNIRGQDVRVGGTVKGNIKSNGQVYLGKNCKLQGDVFYRKLLIEDGAHFEGKCDIVNEENNS